MRRYQTSATRTLPPQRSTHLTEGYGRARRHSFRQEAPIRPEGQDQGE